mmetsp:Transcript_20697/g.52403  ORF Transcript_20697/g.52403 Transcript_20697/m.52403 type:complete len:211 (+) Transcript_20697:2171-2803(+)
MHSRCPLYAALCSGVAPSLSAASSLPLCLTNREMQDELPRQAAKWMGVSPVPVCTIFTFAEALSSREQISSLPLKAAVCRGAAPPLSIIEGSALCRSSSSQMGVLECSTAMWSGAMRSASARLGSAPHASSSATHSWWPANTALCSGVPWMSSSALMSAPSSTRHFTAAKLPLNDAWWRGVSSIWSGMFTSSPFLMSRRMQATCPPKAAL